MELMNGSDKMVELRKIPLAGFIDLLQELYEKGADYVDIIGKPNTQQDIISVVVKEEYVDVYNNGFTEDDDISLPSGDEMINLNDLV